LERTTGLEETGYQFLSVGETGDAKGKAWSECAQIDRRGHDLQLGLASMVTEELEGILERIAELLDAGWRTVRVVTDHGWILMPGGTAKNGFAGLSCREPLGALCSDPRAIEGLRAKGRLVLEQLGGSGDCAGHHGIRGWNELRARWAEHAGVPDSDAHDPALEGRRAGDGSNQDRGMATAALPRDAGSADGWRDCGHTHEGECPRHLPGVRAEGT